MATSPDHRSSTSPSSKEGQENRTSSDGLSVTPATSYEDASTGTKSGLGPSSSAAEDGRALRTRRSQIGSYNESVLSGTAKRRSSIRGGNRTISGETLIDDGPTKDLLQNSINALNLDWTAQQSPSKSPATESILTSRKINRRRSVRLDALAKATAKVVEKVTVLGKRGRDAVDAGKTMARNSAKDLQRRASIRPKLSVEKSVDENEPPTKKARPSTGETLTDEKRAVEAAGSRPGKRLKRWLSHGLYAGQDRTFNPRLTESRNRQKAASAKQDTPAGQNSFLPLPMFAGQRLLDLGRDFKLPFDVFAPLPPGQPKPEEWRKRQKNIFIGTAATLWRGAQPKELSRCICTPESGCGDDCQNRFMFYECDDMNCNIGDEHCTNRSFADLKRRCKAGGKYNIGVEVIKTADRGYGVRSNRTFEPNQIITEYAGEIITQEECDRRMNTVYKKNDCYYLMHFDQNMIIDATRGSIARFVNHSCEPNCRMVKWTVAGKPRMALFAAENGIMAGEELTYDYNFDPFSAKSVQKCLCGSSNCRGVLGPKPKDAKALSNSPEELPAPKGARGKPVKKGKAPGLKSKIATKATARSKALVAIAKGKATATVRKRSTTVKTMLVAGSGKGQLGPKRLKQAAKTVKGRTQAVLKRTLSRQSKSSVVVSESRPTSRSAGTAFRQGVARSLRRTRKTMTPANIGLFESESTIRVIPETESI